MAFDRTDVLNYEWTQVALGNAINSSYERLASDAFAAYVDTISSLVQYDATA